MRTYIALMFLAGAVVPLLWLTLHWFVPTFDHWWLVESPTWLEGLLLALWPSSLLLIGDPEERNLWVPILSTGVNMLLYGMVGVFIWLSRSSNRTSQKRAERTE